MRHAQAQDAATSDLMRPLTELGHDQARKMGNKIRELDIGIDTILCSPALRTKQTLEALELKQKVCFSNTLFEQKGLDSILEEINEKLNTCTSLLVVAHMPYILEVANHFGANINSFEKAQIVILEKTDQTFSMQSVLKPDIT